MFLLFIFSALSALGQTNTSAPPKLSPAYPEIPPTFGERFSPTTQSGQAICISIVLLAALLFFVIWKKLHPPPPPVLPPEVLARQALEKLQGRPEDGQVLSEASQILRRYFGAAFGLPSAEMTTAEFCAALAADDKIGGELAQSVSNLLSVCDKDKFSPKTIVPPINAVSRVHELVELVEKRLAMVGRASSRAETDASSVASPHRNAATK